MPSSQPANDSPSFLGTNAHKTNRTNTGKSSKKNTRETNRTNAREIKFRTNARENKFRTMVMLQVEASRKAIGFGGTRQLTDVDTGYLATFCSQSEYLSVGVFDSRGMRRASEWHRSQPAHANRRTQGQIDSHTHTHTHAHTHTHTHARTHDQHMCTTDRHGTLPPFSFLAYDTKTPP